MPQITGAFSLFPDLDSITAAEISALSSEPLEHHFIENYLGNRILHPQSVATNKQELDLDFYILSIAIKKHPEVLLNAAQNRIIIPEIVMYHFPPLTRLIAVVLLDTPASKVTDLWLKGETDQKLLGSCIPRQLINQLNISGELKLTVQNQEKNLIPNQLNLIPIQEKQVKIVLNQTQNLTAVGGSLGIFVDLRGGTI